MHGDLRRGLLVGGLIAFAIIGPLLYDDYMMHVNGIDLVRLFGGHEVGPWLPLVHADPDVLLRVALGLIAFGVIAWRFARGKGAWSFALAGGVLAAITLANSTLGVLGYPADATVLRIAVVPAIATSALVAALTLAYRHRRAHRPRLA